MTPAPDTPGTSSPQSVISRFDYNPTDAQLRAEQIFRMLVSVLQTPGLFNKFTSALPLPRICLLLLGDRPSSATATQVLRLIEASLRVNSSFSRKFELVSGWNTLKLVIPHAWSPDVQAAAFDVLSAGGYSAQTPELVVVCPQMLPVIFASLRHQLDLLVATSRTGHSPQSTFLSRRLQSYADDQISLGGVWSDS